MVSGVQCARDAQRKRRKNGLVKLLTDEQREKHAKKCTDRYNYIKSVINKCYLKEAHAILEGKDIRGKNKCVKLAGD